MFRNYLKIAFRNILRHKGYSFINITGLAIGMACCFFILLWVADELSYDRYHENANHIYRLCIDAETGGNVVRAPASNVPTAPAMIRDFPEVVNAVRIYVVGKSAITFGEKQFYEKRVFYADNSIFDVFTFPMVKGDPKSALLNPYTVVVTEEIAEKYFGDDDPIGKILKFNNEDNFTISGVVKNVPRNSHFTFDILCSFQTLYSKDRARMERWIGFDYLTYLLLADHCDIKMLEQKFPGFIDKYMGADLEAGGFSLKFFLQPLTRIHLHSHMEFEISGNGDIAYVYLFSGIALFILMIACFNFINLSTARASTRAREVAMRKTLGAVRGRLIRQFLGESVVFSLLSLALALIMVELFIPLFNSLAECDLNIDGLFTPVLITGLAGFVLLVGLAAGGYPAFYLASFRPVKVLKKGIQGGISNSRFRRILVVTQFVISITLIISTITIYNQLDFMKNKKLGFNKEQVVVIPGLDDSIQQSLDSIKEELAGLPGVTAVAAASNVPGEAVGKNVFIPEGYTEEQTQLMNHFYVGYDYIPTLGMEIVAGRNFSVKHETDANEAVLINETAAKKFGWKNAVGKTIRSLVPSEKGMSWRTRRVIGVVKDFHLFSLHRTIEPLFLGMTSEVGTIVIRIAPGNIMQTMNRLKNKWKELVPHHIFDYYFLDESFDNQYRAEEKMGTLTLSFSMLAIFIGCLGLFGMSSYTSEQRKREIGIRKVLGASVPGIMKLISGEFMILMVIACIIAWPAAYFIMSEWLQDFAYRTNIGLWTFMISGTLTLVIALITVSYQSVKAAIANPVEALRYE